MSETVLEIGISTERERFPASEVLYIEGDRNYSKFHRQKAVFSLSSKTLAIYETLLPHFVRIHKRTLVNPAFVDKCLITPNGKVLLVLTNGATLSIARRRVVTFRLKYLVGSHYV